MLRIMGTTFVIPERARTARRKRRQSRKGKREREVEDVLGGSHVVQITIKTSVSPEY
jgi:hypothetical protein